MKKFLVSSLVLFMTFQYVNAESDFKSAEDEVNYLRNDERVDELEKRVDQSLDNLDSKVKDCNVENDKLNNIEKELEIKSDHISSSWNFLNWMTALFSVVVGVIGFSSYSRYKNAIKEIEKIREEAKEKAKIIIDELNDVGGNAENRMKEISKKEINKFVLYFSGINYYKNNEYENAIRYFSKAIENYPDFFEAFYNRGVAKIKLNNYVGAIEDLNEAIRLNPNYWIAYTNRGIAKIKLENYENAIEDFNKSIELNPNDPIDFNNRGIAKIKLENYSEAIEDFDEAVRLNSNFPSSFYNLACTYSLLENFDKVKENLEKYKSLIKIDKDKFENESDFDNFRKAESEWWNSFINS